MVLGFVLALFTSKILHGRTVYRTIFLLPILVPGIVVGAIWKLMYNADFGVINGLRVSSASGRGLARRALARARLCHRREHLALDPVLLPTAPRRH